MGFGMPYLHYIAERGHLNNGDVAILDIGTQNLYHATADDIVRFVETYGEAGDRAELDRFAGHLSHHSWPRPGERTAYLSELLERTRIRYKSFDVCPGLDTEILDLNFEALPAAHAGAFDLVLNFGTTEHIIHQYNCFKIIHDALAVGGVVFHQLPSTGWIDHGYFCYHPLFFAELAKANGYQILDQWYTLAGRASVAEGGVDVRSPEAPGAPASAGDQPGRTEIFSYNLNVVMRKIEDRPFTVTLELATTHAGLDPEIAGRYATGTASDPTGGQRQADNGEALAKVEGGVLLREVWRRVKHRLGAR